MPALWLGLVGLRIFEVELNETFRFGPWQSRRVLAQSFSGCCGSERFLLRASILDEEVPLSISTGVLKQLVSVSTEENRISKLSKCEGSSRSCRWPLDDGSQDEARFFTSETLTTQMWEQASHGQEATLRPSSERNKGVNPQSIAHHVSMTVTPSKDPSHQKTSTASSLSNGSVGLELSYCKSVAPFGPRSLLAISCWRVVARSKVEASAS